MASIVKRKSKYSVVYDYTDENGKRRQALGKTIQQQMQKSKKTEKSKLSMSRTLDLLYSYGKDPERSAR